MKFAIFGNTYQPKKSLHALRLFELLKKQGAEICMCREFYQFLTASSSVFPAWWHLRRLWIIVRKKA